MGPFLFEGNKHLWFSNGLFLIGFLVAPLFAPLVLIGVPLSGAAGLFAAGFFFWGRE
jgi:hypothetical protein